MAESRDHSRIDARLRRLRITLTLTFTATLAAGLVILAALAIATDSRSRRQALDAEMSERVEASSRLIYYSSRGQLRLDGLRDDDATAGSPEIRVLAEDPDNGFRELFRSRGPHLPLTTSSLEQTARRATRSESAVRQETTDRAGADA
ncbi:MAG: sensor histidine kinase, partial [Actinomycetota bacterium]|nr:sensor histidine kinase [Actinomycetota bacterium]